MMTTPSGGYLHSYFIHFHFCGCCGRRSSLQLNIACLHFLTESNGLRQRVMHNITELTVGRNFLPVLAVRTHKEFITESHCRFRFRFQWSIGKTGQCHRLAQVNRQRRSSDLFPTGAGCSNLHPERLPAKEAHNKQPLD